MTRASLLPNIQTFSPPIPTRLSLQKTMKQSDPSPPPARAPLSSPSQPAVSFSASPPSVAAIITPAARAACPRWLLLSLAIAIIFTDAVGYTIIIPGAAELCGGIGIGRNPRGDPVCLIRVDFPSPVSPLCLLVDRWGERRWLAVGMLTLGLASLGFWQASGFWSLLGCRVTQGIAASATWAAALPLAARLATTERRGVEMSVLMMAFSVGVVAGPALGSLGQVRDPFLYFAGVPLGLALCAFALLPRASTPSHPKGCSRRGCPILFPRWIPA